MAQPLRNRVQWIQAHLNFESWSEQEYPQFSSRGGLGRVALLGCILGFGWGFHFVLWVQSTLYLYYNSQNETIANVSTNALWLDAERMQLLWQWCAYGTCMCTFHLLEFFVTVLYNPTQATADSFLVNHSTAYTAAALTSWTEFGLRLCFVPRWNLPVRVIGLGLALVLVAQTIRSAAMATAGESFNHLIQTSKKNNHVLITHGIYSFLRHPSYVGFFYWSMATQLVLGNAVHTVLFAVASWMFFHKRIAYEEESLCQFFPDTYPSYVATTYVGIPFLSSKIVRPSKKGL